jgi:hypothetical protein
MVGRTLGGFGVFAAGLTVLLVSLRPAAADKAVVTPEQRKSLINRAAVWTNETISTKDLKTGPEAEDAFPPGGTVACTYVDETFEGNTPKFGCLLPPKDRVKVKYGEHNGEVYAEVAATRLLWALGFGADRMYPVIVRCSGCPPKFKGSPDRDQLQFVDPASIERQFTGKEIQSADGKGWSWRELDGVSEAAGGASRAQRDALKLTAVLIQHTDSKAANQRLVCLDNSRPADPAACAQPFMLINDLGVTFGRANTFNRGGPGSVNFKAWADTPVWIGASGCIGNLEKSVTGTLDRPVISEEGRAFLSGLLDQLSDAQLRDLFTVARFERRSHHSADEWVGAFNDKRRQIRERHCSF